ncbi:MAG: AMP phosphorylase [Parcubacteria group bacterium CG08_land_8_20_14_0_20_48_21]|nr:MAG: AMP phosphorylase [Parcubacteria group bacterium CG2_30_48_51]PIS32942.1 MAG: AMP phosphorylase [Parcubacteria group bacterium CG08_land_8_20_14_0_20_48_21]PIW79161.1 MAG: AMP phosphorylase [Parcubacteria group bacterium CG_4_8_14_3_um_filter_48_16]PIY77809.1 MAG: AMP phosphorylase [Parcubacteria group bacterium CG_4_10_14_0_8_um_filter_48_154]PIZ77978.1 MAG: AMP phosphorylase [bacterium CG_4_10_14_0_2_um_filter_48_144]PJC39836.1 MAG: AMP phosphorylase [Parcubacteria group bacterium CG
MPFYLRAKKIDYTAGKESIIALNQKEAWHYGLRPGDKIALETNGNHFIAIINTTKTRINAGDVGIYSDLWDRYGLREGEIIEMHFLKRAESIEAIKKKLLGESLTEKDFNAVVNDIVTERIGPTEIAYFVASSFPYPYTDRELYYLTKAVASHGEQLHLRGTVVDKHSVGGVAGNRTTMIVVPIIACTGLIIPKTSSRAITSPAGTADTMEVLAPVSFTAEKIKKIVQKHKGCLVWGGGVNLAPADDKIIKVSYPLSFEPYEKMMVSIMAKKVASDVKYLVIDMPIGEFVKIPDMRTARMLAQRFVRLGKKFGIKVRVLITRAKEPVGRGVGPALEARDVLRVLQQTEHLPTDLEKKSLMLAGMLLELAGKAKKGKGVNMARTILTSGTAWRKMAAFIRAQGGNPKITPDDVILGPVKHYLEAQQTGKIVEVNNRTINDICRALGAPEEKLAGMYLNKRLGQRVQKGARLCTLYAATDTRMKLAVKTLEKQAVFTIARAPYIKKR